MCPYSFDVAIGAKDEKKIGSGNEKKSSVVWTCPMFGDSTRFHCSQERVPTR